MATTYLIVNSFCIAFLMILFFSIGDHVTRHTEAHCFRLIVVMTSLALVSDMIGWQIDGKIGSGYRYLLWIIDSLNYFLSGAITFAWVYYSALKLKSIKNISKVGWVVIALPAAFLAVLSLLTPWTHWIFYIDSANVYHRGPMFFVQMLIPFGYIIAASLWAMHRAGKEKLRQQRREYLALAAFAVFPCVGGVLQFMFYGVSIVWPCTALSLLLVYVNIQNQKISLDALTGLNNRGQFDKLVNGYIERADNDTQFVLFMLDIDNFKEINDRFGHTVGDAALIDASFVLKNALKDTRSFFARYGGDEFAIVLNYTDKHEVDEISSIIIKEAEEQNRRSEAPYKLTFSMGYVYFERSKYFNYLEMIADADEQMYIQKREHKGR